MIMINVRDLYVHSLFSQDSDENISNTQASTYTGIYGSPGGNSK